MHSDPTSATPYAPITPWPLPHAHTTILVGGTFDPPHKAHIRLPAQLRDSAFPSSSLLFIPAAWSPLKPDSPHTPSHHRIEMLRLATRDLPNAALWTDEIDRHAAAPGSPSYTIDTVLRAKAVAPITNLRLLIGADQAAQFHRWRRFRELLALAPPIVMLREPHPTIDSLSGELRATGEWSEPELAQWTRWCVPAIPVTDMSASDIRTALHSGQPAPTLPELDPMVAAYIEAHHLYRPRVEPPTSD